MKLRSELGMIFWRERAGLKNFIPKIEFNYFDSKYNPNGTGILSKFEKKDKYIIDKETRLMWFNKKITESCTFAMLVERYEQFNENREDVFLDWRIPTLNELYSINKPIKMYGSHIWMDFVIKDWIWSGDVYSFQTKKRLRYTKIKKSGWSINYRIGGAIMTNWKNKHDLLLVRTI
jgi:hypothetical protein